MLTHEEFKSRDHFDQEELLGFAYGRLIKDPPEGGSQPEDMNIFAEIDANGDKVIDEDEQSASNPALHTEIQWTTIEKNDHSISRPGPEHGWCTHGSRAAAAGECKRQGNFVQNDDHESSVAEGEEGQEEGAPEAGGKVRGHEVLRAEARVPQPERQSERLRLYSDRPLG